MNTPVYAVDIEADGSPVSQMTLPFPVEFGALGATEITLDGKPLRVFQSELDAYKYGHRLAIKEVARLRVWLDRKDAMLACD